MDEPAITIDNLQPEGQDMQKVCGIIQRIANDPVFQIPVPFPTLILSLLLRRLTEPIISYQQCQSIAAQCGITERKHLDEALNFLHTKLGVVRHFQKIPELREIVIQDPQILFDNLVSNIFTFIPLQLKHFSRRAFSPDERSKSSQPLLTSCSQHRGY